MKEYTYRGIRKDNGEFVYGYYFKISEMHFIIKNDAELYNSNSTDIVGFLPCDMELITQVPDRFFKTIDGVDIWENDIVAYGKIIGYIGYSDLRDCYVINGKRINNIPTFGKPIKLIGNIHFNKELLEE